MRKTRKIPALASAIIVLVALSGCSSNGGSSTTSAAVPGTIDKHLSGSTITILMPPWSQMKASDYQAFTDLTGIKIKLDIEQFDQVHDKVVTAMAANVPPADVIEVDSLWIGQFGAAKWLAPLENLIAPSALSTVGAKEIFQYDHVQIAMPYALDFRWIAVNMTMLEKAGITAAPATWPDLLAAAKALKAKGISKYPIGIPTSVTAETVEPWLNLTKMAGGELLDASGKPAFNDPNSAGFKSLQFLQSAYAAGLVNPGYANVQGEKVQEDFAAGLVAFDMRNGPSVAYNDPVKAKVAKDNIQRIVIGETAIANTVYGLPEGMGIPANSKNIEAAAMFISWFNLAPQEVALYGVSFPGVLPAQPATLEELIKAGTLPDGDKIKSILPGVVPLFPLGAPTWWPQFANDAAATIQAVLVGQKSVKTELDKLAEKTVALTAKG